MDGNVILTTELDTRPVVKALSDIKNKVVTIFKGVDRNALSAEFRAVTAELKTTEAQARKAQAALDALMSGEKTPQSVKELERELVSTEKQAEKMSRGYEKMLADAEKYKEYAEYDPKFFPEAQKFHEAQAALERYEKEWAALDEKAERLRNTLDVLRQNPQLTAEAQKYQEQLNVAEQRLVELRARQEELGASSQKVGVMTRLQQNSIVTGFQHIERRILGLVKRVFFFTLITKALRAVRSQVSALISSDSQLSASLAQIKGNLAASFGMIWQAVVPAIRTMINWIAKATAYIAAFISWLTGKSFKQGQEAFQAANSASAGTAKNTGKIGKAAKKAAKEAQRMLLSFDQMNILSKDNADAGAGGAGGGGGGGAGGLGGMTWPKEMDSVMAKFDKFKDLILLIGSAFAAWKLSKIASTLLGISRIRAFVGLTSLIAGIMLLVTSIRDLIKNGPNVENICGIIAGGLLTVGGAILLLTGATGIGAIIIAIGLLVLAFRNLYKNFAPFREYIDKALKSIKKAFGKGKLKGFVEIGKQILLGVLKGIVWVVKKLGSWIKKNVVDKFITWCKKKFGIGSPAKVMIDIGKNIMLGVLEGILEPIKKIGSWIKENVLEPIKNAFSSDSDDGFVIDIVTAFSDTKETIAAKWNEITSGIKEKVATILTEVKEKVAGALESLRTTWELVKDRTVTLWSEVKEKVSGALTTLKTAWDSIANKTVTLVGQAVNKASSVLSVLRSGWSSVTNKTATLTAKVVNKSGGLFNTVRSAWASIKNKTATLSINIKAAVGNAYNSAARKINGLLGKLPSPVRPSWRLPYLAQGAVIPANKEFLAVLGDQKRGVNIETPLQTMIDAFNTALQQNGMGGNQNINVYLQGDAKQLFRVVRVEANNYTQSTGKAAFNL